MLPAAPVSICPRCKRQSRRGKAISQIDPTAAKRTLPRQGDIRSRILPSIASIDFLRFFSRLCIQIDSPRIPIYTWHIHELLEEIKMEDLGLGVGLAALAF